MREYETIFVLEPEMDEGAIDEQISRVCQIIENRGGAVHEVQRWGRRRLAYPIRKKNDGVYTFIRFGGNNSVLTELEHRYGLNESLLRHLTVLCEFLPPGKPKEAADAGPAETAPRADMPADEAEAPPGPVEPELPDDVTRREES